MEDGSQPTPAPEVRVDQAQDVAEIQASGERSGRRQLGALMRKNCIIKVGVLAMLID